MKSYLLMQIPSNLFLNKFGKPAIYLPTCVCMTKRPRHKRTKGLIAMNSSRMGQTDPE